MALSKGISLVGWGKGMYTGRNDPFGTSKVHKWCSASIIVDILLPVLHSIHLDHSYLASLFAQVICTSLLLKVYF